MDRWTLIAVLFCGFISYSYGQTGNFDNMANDPSILLEPNPSGGLLPPPDSSPRKKKKNKSLLDMIDTPAAVDVNGNQPPEAVFQEPRVDAFNPPRPDEQPVGFQEQPMVMPEQPVVMDNPATGGGLLDQPTPVEQPSPPEQPMEPVNMGNNNPFSLGGSVVKEWIPSNFADVGGRTDWMPSNFADNMGSNVDRNRMVPDVGTPSKSVNQIFNSDLGSFQVAGTGADAMRMTPKEQPMVESPFNMENAGVLDFQEFGNAIDLKATANKGEQVLDMAMGIVDRDPNVIPGSQRNEKEYTFFHETQCRTRAHFTAAGKMDETTYEEYLNGKWEVRLCAPGSGYNVTTCGCTNMLPIGYNGGRDNNKGCGPDMSLSFRGGVRDTSGNRAAVDYYGVDVSDGTAFFDGSNRLYIWRYQSYDYRDKLQISFKFKPVPGTRMEPYTLVSNCEGNDEPSYGIVLNSFSNITTIFLKTYEIENQRFMTFDINPTTWNDVYFRYQNGTLIGRVNNEIKTRPLIGNIQKRPDAMVFANCKRYGNYKGHLKDIVVYSKCLPPLDKQVDSYLNGLP
ncbi:asparagine-rich protein-like isoform X2 [Crassostrea virginica]